MNEYLAGQSKERIGDLYTDINFIAFVMDFYYASPWSDRTDITIDEVYDIIFSNSEVYKQFLTFCEEGNFGLIHESGDTHIYKKALQLLSYEKTRRVILDGKGKVFDILELSRYDIFNEALNSFIGNSGVSFWNGLRTSIYKGIPLNNFGEVLYIYGITDVGYNVFSYERGEHHVNKLGQVQTRLEFFKNEEAKFIAELIELKELIENIDTIDFTDESTLPVLFQEFKAKKAQKGDTISFLRTGFQFYIGQRIAEIQSKLKDIRKEGFGFIPIEVFGGTDLGD